MVPLFWRDSLWVSGRMRTCACVCVCVCVCAYDSDGGSNMPSSLILSLMLNRLLLSTTCACMEHHAPTLTPHAHSLMLWLFFFWRSFSTILGSMLITRGQRVCVCGEVKSHACEVPMHLPMASPRFISSTLAGQEAETCPMMTGVPPLGPVVDPPTPLLPTTPNWSNRLLVTGS